MPRTTRSSAIKAKSPDNAMENATQQLSSPPETPAVTKKAQGKAKAASKVKKETCVTPPKAGRKRVRKSAVKIEDDGDVNELPHNLGTALPTPNADSEDAVEPPKKRARKSTKSEAIDAAAQLDEGEVKDEVSKLENNETKVETISTPTGGKTKTLKTPKKANYGLTPGLSPFPDYARPTPEDCKEVVRLLSKVHGTVKAPESIPPPSLDVAGCGEVPSVVDALVRTRLSANTTNKNSSTAFQGLVKRFGILKEGVGKGSVDWNAVRVASFEDVRDAIKQGGLANIKAADIQSMLQMTWEENQERSAALQSSLRDPAGAEKEAAAEKNMEVQKASQNVLSLDHLHLLSTPDAIAKMTTFKGIGPKTASCVALFCLQRPSFAVDTHVFRLCQYLGWVPKTTKKGQPKVDRNTTYSHCDVRIPDEYKYALHQLLIKHGKICPRCRAITGQSSADWDQGCPIEHLVTRHGAKKGGVSVVARKKAKAAAAAEDESSADETPDDTAGEGADSELSEMESSHE